MHEIKDTEHLQILIRTDSSEWLMQDDVTSPGPPLSGCKSLPFRAAKLRERTDTVTNLKKKNWSTAHARYMHRVRSAVRACLYYY